jgi:hypothetical protein
MNILGDTLSNLRDQRIQGDARGAYNDMRKFVGMDLMGRNRAEGYDRNNPNAKQAFKDRELALLASYDPEKAMRMSGDYATAKGVTSTRWDRQREAMKDPEAKRLIAEYNEVMTQITNARDNNNTARIAPLKRKLSKIEHDFFQKFNLKIPNKMARETFKEETQARALVEGDQDEAWQSYEGVMKQYIPEMDKSLKLVRVGTDALNSALGLMESKWDPETKTFLPNTNTASIQTAIKAFVRSIDNSVVMQGEIERVVGSDLVDTLLSIPNQWTQGHKYTKEQQEMIFDTMVQSAHLKDSLMKKVIDGTMSEANNKVNTAVGFDRISHSQGELIKKEILNTATSRSDKYKLIDGVGPVGVFQDILGETEVKKQPVDTNTIDPNEEDLDSWE